jgi:phosphorylcholine metabolism protein LicD
MITKQQAFKNLSDFKKAMNNTGIPFFLDAGALLGAYRDNDFPDDDQNDIDLTTYHDYWFKVDVLVEEAKEMGFSIIHKWDSQHYEDNGKMATSQISFRRNGGKIDVMFKKVKGDWLWWTIFKKNKAGLFTLVYKKTPFKFFRETEKIKFYGEEFNRPKMIEEYFAYRYGDWKTPVHRSKYSCFTSDKSIVKSYEEI